MRQTQAQLDGYVECAECGAPVEDHDRDGYPDLGCTVSWTKRAIGDLRQAEGLPRTYHRYGIGPERF